MTHHTFCSRWLCSITLTGLWLLGLTAREAGAASGSWVPTTGGAYSWNVNGNWSGATFPNDHDETARLTNDIAGNQTINLNQVIGIGNMHVGDADGSASFLVAAGSGGSFDFNAWANHTYLYQVASSKGDTIAANIKFTNQGHIYNSNTVNALTLAGVISGSTAMDYNGPGKLILGGANTISGGLTIKGGTVVATHTQALGNSSSAVSFTTGSTLQLLQNGTGSNGTIIFGSVNNPTGYSLAHSASATVTVAVGRVSANTGNTIQLNNLTTIDSNNQRLVIEGEHGYRLRFAGNTTIGAVNVTPFVLEPNSADVMLNTISTLNKLTLAGTGRGTIEGAISGTMRSLIKTNTGLWVLAGNNTFTPVVSSIGVEVKGGTLRLAHVNALPGGIGATGGNSTLLIRGGVLELGANDFTRPLNVQNWDVKTNQVLLASGGFSAHGANRYVNFGGAGATVVWGQSGSDFTGTLILNSPYADAQIDFQNPLNLNGAVRTIQVNDNPNSTTDRALLSGVVSGGAGSALTKTGAGTLLLSANNTYSGQTTVGLGTLVVNGTHANAGNYLVQSGATLSGSGTINFGAGSSATVSSGGSIVPGNSIGTLTLNGGGLTLASQSVSVFEIEGIPVPGADFDVITSDSGLTYQPGWQLQLQFLNPATAPISGSIQLFDFASYSGTNNAPTITLLHSGADSVAFDAATGWLTFANAYAIPEPSALFLLGVGAWLLVRAGAVGRGVRFQVSGVRSGDPRAVRKT